MFTCIFLEGITDTYTFISKKLSGLMSPWMISTECKWWTIFNIWLAKCMTKLSCITCGIFNAFIIWKYLKQVKIKQYYYLGRRLPHPIIDIQQRAELRKFRYKNTGIWRNERRWNVHKTEQLQRWMTEIIIFFVFIYVYIFAYEGDLPNLDF